MGGDYFKSFDGTEIYYEIRKKSPIMPRVSFIHGQSGGNFTMLQNQIDFVSDRGCTTLAFDLRGGGRSELMNGRGKEFYSLENLAKDFIGLLDHTEIEKTNVVAYSLGTTIALKAFEIKPEAIDSLTLLHPTYSPFQTTSKRNKFIIQIGLCAFLENSFSKTFSIINKIRGVKERELFEYKPFVGISDYINFRYLMTRTPEELNSRLNFSNNRLKWGVEKTLLDEIDAPVLCISGSKDIWVLPSAAEEIAQRVQDGKVKIFQGHKHDAVYANPEPINQEIWEFLKSLEKFKI